MTSLFLFFPLSICIIKHHSSINTRFTVGSHSVVYYTSVREPLRGDYPSSYWIVLEAKMRFVRATGHKTPGESSVNITVSVYDTTHLQENPQRIG